MRKGMKIFLIIGAFIIMAVINSIIMEGSGSKTGGPIGLILFIAFIAGAMAIWKYNPDNSNGNSSDNKHNLDKN